MLTRRWSVRVLLVLATVVLVTACASGDGSSSEQVSPGEPADAEGTRGGEPSEDGSPFTPPTLAIADSVPPPPEEAPEDAVNLDGSDVNGDPLLPTDLVSAVELGVDQGRWGEAEGVALALAGIAGWHGQVVGLGLDEVEEPNITDLLRWAGTLETDAGTDPETAAALAAAIRFFSPTQAVLDSISEPSGREVSAGDFGADEESTGGEEADGEVAMSGGIVPVAYNAQGGEIGLECSAVANMGFGVTESSETSCYVYDELTIQGNRLRIYYPRAWRGDETQEGKVDLTFEALIKSTVDFSTMVPVGGVTAIFALQDFGERTAYVSAHEPGEACPVTMSASMWSSGGDNRTRQIIAHEVFHCVQVLNFGANVGGDRWWREGSAEYFSNVVYPDFDFEHERVVNFDSGSISKPLTEMDYENAIFFQYLANRRGNSAVLELLGAAAGGGGEAALKALDGADELWQEFVVAAVAGAVDDPSGEAWPRLKNGTGRITISAVGETSLDTQPFVATRYLVVYEKEKRFVQTTEQMPLHASVERDKVTDVEAWTELPMEVRSECKEPDRRILVTTNIDGAPFVVKVDKVEKASCDPCVLGAWQMNLATFQTYMMGVFDAIGGFPTGVEFEMFFTGAYYAEFKAERNQASFVRQPLNITILADGAPPIIIAVEGTDTASYQADGEKLSVTGLSGTATAGAGLLFSEESGLGVSIGPFSMDGPDSGSASYTCEDDVMVTTDATYGSITYNRIDRIPEPDDVTVETGETGE